MKKIVGIALASNVLFLNNTMGKPPKVEGEPDYDEVQVVQVVQVCEGKATNLGLGEEGPEMSK